MERILQEFLIFSNNYLKIFNFYEIYKSSEIFGEFYYLVQKLQWQRKKFFRGNALGTERLSSTPRRGSGGEGPQGGSEVSFLKRFKVFENEFIYQKGQHFSSPKDPFFLRKNSKNSTYLTGIYELFRKII